jgi:DNA mismatch endonuclease, patch repair protein
VKPAAAFVAAKMRRQRRRDTPCELLVRRCLYALGLRYRIDAFPEPGLRRRADIVFPRQKVAVFIDGCFWHACPVHASWPKENGAWWREKLMRNSARDHDTTIKLREAGWVVLRFWEHEDPACSADRVAQVVQRTTPTAD